MFDDQKKMIGYIVLKFDLPRLGSINALVLERHINAQWHCIEAGKYILSEDVLEKGLLAFSCEGKIIDPVP